MVIVLVERTILDAMSAIILSRSSRFRWFK